MSNPCPHKTLRLEIEQQAAYYFGEIRKFQPLDLDHLSLDNWKDFMVWRVGVSPAGTGQPDGDAEELARNIATMCGAGEFDTDLHARVAALLRSRMAERWEPMETAPRDGTRILVNFGQHGVHAVSWEEPASGYVTLWCVDDLKHGPYALRRYIESDVKGWRPLPSAPDTEKA